MWSSTTTCTFFDRARNFALVDRHHRHALLFRQGIVERRCGGNNDFSPWSSMNNNSCRWLSRPRYKFEIPRCSSLNISSALVHEQVGWKSIKWVTVNQPFGLKLLEDVRQVHQGKSKNPNCSTKKNKPFIWALTTFPRDLHDNLLWNLLGMWHAVAVKATSLTCLYTRYLQDTQVRNQYLFLAVYLLLSRR